VTITPGLPPPPNWFFDGTEYVHADATCPAGVYLPGQVRVVVLLLLLVVPLLLAAPATAPAAALAPVARTDTSVYLAGQRSKYHPEMVEWEREWLLQEEVTVGTWEFTCTAVCTPLIELHCLP